MLFPVIPVETGIQYFQRVKFSLDSRFRGRDDFLRSRQFYILKICIYLFSIRKFLYNVLKFFVWIASQRMHNWSSPSEAV